MGELPRTSSVTLLRSSRPSFCSGASFRSLLPSSSVVTKLRPALAVAPVLPATSMVAPAPITMRAPSSSASKRAPVMASAR